MVFAGVPFLFYFLPVLLAAYFIVPMRMRAGRNLVLLVGSLIFYAWGEGSYVLLLLLSIFMNHLIAHRLGRTALARRWLIGGVAANLLLLGWFKYAGFFGRSIGLGEIADPHLPLGISFFTFQAISYLVDVARQEAKPARRLIDSALYIASFPQLIAGPIVRFQTIATALTERRETIALFAEGVRIFLLGLGQKVLFANLAAGPADAIFALPADGLSPVLAWIGMVAYSLQIFFDFAGYSNMAIGLGLMVGFRFPANFATPYCAQSVTEFWRRWHMTLSRWFRDYLYIPLGGNRHGEGRTIANLWIVFLLCGLWHGAAWTFVLWGAWHGLFLSVERLARQHTRWTLPRPLRHLYLLVAVMFGWVLFRADTLSHAGDLYTALLGRQGTDALPLAAYLPGMTGLWLGVAALFATPLPQLIMTGLMNRAPLAVSAPSTIIGFSLLFVACAAFVAGGAYNPFIYFRF
ncbi:MBOAT family protein [Parvularcula sp. LCG005]|uniref:MBOAT family O-acyltransferase n=1 Tax=Parvularcula sp. LCG005 TaxID=3078805 RepID=UPI002943D7CA|nr:MBOAT family protein [Parvularcula sp. LCG005]WOI53140.1 MBOAT family protein [Parvularcula sp. LCG005]